MSKTEILTVYITRYALTHGILMEDCEVTAGESMARRRDRNGIEYYYHAGEWHKDKASAIA